MPKTRRRKKNSKSKRRSKRLLLRMAFISTTVIIGALALLVLVMSNGWLGPMPEKGELRSIENMQASEIYDANQRLIGKYFIQNRKIVDYEAISPWLVKALIATEDARFYQHKGIDYRSLARVAVKTILLQNERAGGGSTISQQLAKNLYPRHPYPFLALPLNKLREMILARRLEQFYSKEELLTLYLNTVPFGENVFGIEAASQRFFSTSAKNLLPTQAAVLVGMLKATTYYNPRLHPDRSLGRRNVVLRQMVKAGHLASNSADELSKQPLGLQYNNADKNVAVGAYFVEHLRHEVQQILKEISDERDTSINLYTDGLRIYTTLDLAMQQYAEKAMQVHMQALQKTFETHWQKGQKPWENEQLIQLALRQDRAYAEVKRSKNHPDSIDQWLNTAHNTLRFSWQGPEESKMSPLDSVRHHLRFLQAGFLAMDPQSGHIKVWLGGIDHRFFKYDHVSPAARRQVGSVFKPIVYAAALEAGVSPCEYIEAEQAVFVENDKEWKPSNADNQYEGKYSMEGALTESVNTVAVKILETVGVEKAVALARDMGIQSDIPKVPSIALGTPSISLYEMVRAYAVFANGGVLVEPVSLLRIEDSRGQLLWEKPKTTAQRVLSRETSQLMTEMLKSVVNKGTAARMRSTYAVHNDMGGKTGTTQHNADGWFLAITPKLVTGAWVGGEFPAIHFRSTSLGQGASTALPITARFYQQLNKNAQYRHISNARFGAPPDYLLKELDCDPFAEDLNFWESIFGKKKGDAEVRDDNAEDKKEKGLFNAIKGLFKKKQ
jgi:penicillin-binding protein 1A